MVDKIHLAVGDTAFFKNDPYRRIGTVEEVAGPHFGHTHVRLSYGNGMYAEGLGMDFVPTPGMPQDHRPNIS